MRGRKHSPAVARPFNGDPLIWQFALLALRNPLLIPPLLAAGWRFRHRHWYRRMPFLPLPPREYLEWRLHTAFGDDHRMPASSELHRYLHWMRWMNSTDHRGDLK